MKTLSKICDAADWFDPEFQRVIADELREPARYHRKQWEFAMIFLTLEKLDYLDKNKVGLSMGGGCERVLYSIANKVKKLFVTDLYSDENDWDTARTNDPKDFIISNKPFEVDDSKIEAISMDMRELKFDDDSFDFCYSSCAIEHIGDYSDFITHLNEVYRVLKDGGIYVLTTEFLFSNNTIKDKHNYYFSPSYLSNIILNSNLIPVYDPFIGLTKHNINLPMPARPENYFSSENSGTYSFFCSNLPHVILLRGKHPFTSVSLILKKQNKIVNKPFFVFNGLESTRAYLEEGVNYFLKKLNESNINLSPFSGLPKGISQLFQGHEEFFLNTKSNLKQDNTIFHTEYLWLGDGFRTVKLKMLFDQFNNEDCHIELRVHRFATFNSSEIECIYENTIFISAENSFEKEICIQFNPDYNYAILAKCLSGCIFLKDVQLTLSQVYSYKKDLASAEIVEAESRG
jgi:Methyltransferase domain